MELNITTGFKIFEKHYNRIAESLGVSNASGHELENFIAFRALILLKLDLLLINHRNSIDQERLFLFGKNTLHHYLFTEKGIPFSEAKKLNLQDSLLIILQEVSTYSVPTELMNLLKNEFNFSSNNIKYVKDELRAFKDSDWDFGPADTRLN
ncbi:TPA: ECs1072 family phage-associated protein [Citrobacter freundii]